MASWRKHLGIGLGLFAAGWLLGRLASPPAAGSTSKPSATTRTTPVSSAMVHSPTEALRQFIAGHSTLGRRELRALLRQADAGQIRDLVALNETNPRFFDRGWVRRTLLERWAASAPGEALQWAQGLGRLEERYESAATVCSGWAETDPQAAAAAAWDVRRPQLRMAALKSVIATWTQRDPEAVRAWIDGLQSPEQKALSRAFYSINFAMVSPRQALDEAVAHNRSLMLHRAVRNFASRDPIAAIQAVDALPAGVLRDQAEQCLVTGIGRIDPNAACAVALANENSALRPQLMATAARRLAEHDPRVAIEWIQANIDNASNRNEALGTAAKTLACTSPSEAAAIAAMIDGATRDVAARWAAIEPAAALSWARQLPAGADQSAAYSAILGELFRTDPVGALATAQQSFPDTALVEALGDIGRSATEYGPSTCLTLLGQMHDGPAKENFIHALAIEFAGSDTAAATALVDLLPPGATHDTTIHQVAQAWRDHDPATAAAWVLSLPETPARAEAIASVVESWIAVDSGTVAEWVHRLPDGPSRDRALKAAITELGRADPPAAARWVVELPPGEGRQRAVTFVAKHWLQADRTAALRWLATTDLPAEEQTKLVKEGKGAP